MEDTSSTPSHRSSARIIAVHGGAGFHPLSKASDTEIKRALRSACIRASAVLGRGGEASLQAVVDAITILEDNECLNAGYGSNLTMAGTVECDASLMDGRTGDFGAVGAVSGVKNPIRLSHSVLQYAGAPDPLGRIPPLYVTLIRLECGNLFWVRMLVSTGAQDFARTRDMACPPESLVSSRAQREWEKWNTALEVARSAPVRSDPHTPSPSTAHRPRTDGLYDKQDTVGAIALDAEGNLAAGVSSGGLLLKHPGRVGEAALYGAGCWATNEVACSVSGAGEYIMRLSLARAVCEAVEAAGDAEDTHSILNRILGEQFRKLCLARGETSPQAGILLMVKECNADGEFKPRLWCAFTTESMSVGYVSGPSSKPSVMILRRPARSSGESASVYIAALPLNH
ncbi:N-terminal nucleophile aminohydrolase [Trametes coccinea BRFM310]|uniref:N-terminal nucleophile aminohydrolase n=1 Tax=Trametes coccinea (strain BRFM310) TaxID=1353009 RepID=A0A1Y2J3V2_TRAC3|nr:N-terminal nucleophile aminohydrolase [Trametes coccinea BRFM310]